MKKSTIRFFLSDVGGLGRHGSRHWSSLKKQLRRLRLLLFQIKAILPG